MNTSEVAKLLGVSVSTIKRWVKQLELEMERNERGHYLFTDESIEYLKFIQVQINNGILLNDISAQPEKTPRKGMVKRVENNGEFEKLAKKIDSLEKRLDEKADSVTSYQLLQHRSEIEDLQKLVNSLADKINELEEEVVSLKQRLPDDQSLTFEHNQELKKPKKKNLLSSLFGF